MKLIKSIFRKLPISSLQSWELNPPDRIKQDVAFRRLKIAIEKTKSIACITVIHIMDNHGGKKYMIIDGHRRVEIAKEMGEIEINCEIVDFQDIKIPFEEWFSFYNVNKKISNQSRQYIYKITRNSNVLNRPEKLALEYLLKTGGIELIDSIIDYPRSLSASYRMGIEILNYCKVDLWNIDQSLRVQKWLIDHEENFRKLSDLLKRKSIRPQKLWDDIENDEPFTGV